jgi:hypothetical protein
MARLLLGVAVTLAFPGLVSAWIFTSNWRLDHALWPGHDPRLVVAGQIDLGDEKGKSFLWSETLVRFRVSGVILGANSYRGKTLEIPVKSFLWPETLVPRRKGTSCILVLQPAQGKHGKEYALYTVVPGRKKTYPRARDAIAARGILAEELLAQLEAEKSQARQRELLLQVAPVLARGKVGVVEGFLKSPDPWVRRSALAALVYATEAPKHLEAAARDVQDYFTQTKGFKWVDGLQRGVRMRPTTLLLEHYFFLERSTWTWGTRWDEEEAKKHLRILNAMLDKKVIEKWVRKRLLQE